MTEKLFSCSYNKKASQKKMNNIEHLNSIRAAANEARKYYRSLSEDEKAAYREARRVRKKDAVLARYYRNREAILARMKAARDAKKAAKAE